MALQLKSHNRSAAEQLRERFTAAWARSDKIFALVEAGRTLAQPIVWRHPFIFYIGHLPAFSWNQVCGGILHWPSFNAYFDDLFCRGIDPDVDTGECHWHPEVPDQWPSIGATREYRDKVRRALLESTEAIAYCRSTDLLAHSGRVFELILEHEYMHQETLMYMLQQLAADAKLRPRDLPRYAFGGTAATQSVRIPAGKARLGARFDEIAFGWDNEFSEITVDVAEFRIDSLPVTNGKFLEFVSAGGYAEPGYWRAEDWGWKELEQKQHPTCWLKRADHWCYRAMFDLLPLELVASWPVYVSLAEARAYAVWRGQRLPTEAEYQRAAYYGPNERESMYPWGDADPSPHYGNFDFAAWSPQPVGSHPAGASRWGVQELLGNGWELTETPFAPLPGFTPYMRTYPDYSKDFFDGKHFVVKGASWATDRQLLRPSFRNWYQAHYPYVFAKFRCVND
jgi:ergothioneine biosynthesis protein EgtB